MKKPAGCLFFLFGQDSIPPRENERERERETQCRTPDAAVVRKIVIIRWRSHLVPEITHYQPVSVRNL